MNKNPAQFGYIHSWKSPKDLDLVDLLFAGFHLQLAEKGYVARSGQMIDATFVEVPRQRNTREENAQIKVSVAGTKVPDLNSHIHSATLTIATRKNRIFRLTLQNYS